ncbi:MAG: TrlF family AAA-like ATPase [Pseudonocardiaceae bacterium]
MTSLPDVPSGATWRCVDLHLHTPGVHSFALPGGTDEHNEVHRERIAEEYVERLRVAGIEVAAITDYQGVRTEWFLVIRERATGITVLPGAELSIDNVGKGLHLLLVCDPGTDPDRITDAIRHLGKQSQPLFTGRAQHVDLELRDPLDEAVRAIRKELGCVVVAPHASEKNGILEEWGARKTAELVRDGLLDAIDHCEDAVTSLQGTGILTPEQLDSLACTLSGDPKRLDEVGTKTTSDGRPRLTWIKLSAVDASALRLALHDPQTRVLTRRPAPARHPRILSMEVHGNFLDGLTLRFNDDLSTLIGGRGAGKSAVLETLRYALDGPVYSDQSERISLVRHAMGSGGRVRLLVERPGPLRAQRYEITRVLDQEPRVTDLGTGAAVEVPPLELFGAGASPVILLQREIQAVARDDSFRRQLLDEIIGDDARQADLTVRRTVEDLRRNQRAIEDVERQLARREEYTERLGRLNAEVNFFEQQGVADKLDRQGKASADRARLDTATLRARDASSAHTAAAAEITEALTAASADLRASQSEYAGVLAELAGDVETTRERISQALDTAHGELQALQERLGDAVARWQTLVSDLDEDLRRIQAELGGGGLDAQRYIDAVEERTALQPIVDRLARHEDELRNLHGRRRELLRQLQDQRRQALALRRRAANDVNQQLAGTLEMTVSYLADTTDFTSRLTAILKGSRVSSDAIDAITAHPGTDGVEFSLLVAQGASAVTERFGITEAMAQRLVRWFTDEPTRLRQVEVLAPQDSVSIALIIDGRPRDLAQLSGGQKATALLLLVFAQGGRPLVLDQPEDDLDNRFVYDDVVSLLRAEKGVKDPARRRQIIAATHNANIPVNGDAELVLSLVDDNGHCAVRTRASIDDATVREEIRTVLEGGADAFRRRAEKYGGLDDA